MNVEKDNKTGLYYRPEKKELFIIREQPQYKTLTFKDKRFMDVGANIGAVSYMALKGGASAIIGYEPMPDTFEVLKMNMENKATILNKALVGDNKQFISFYLHKKYPSCHTTVPVKGRDKIDVGCLNFWNELNNFKPQVIKMDIEGAEYDFMLQNNFPDYVEQFAIELHMKNEKQKQMAIQIVKKFDNWYVHRKFKFNWHVTTMVIKKNEPSEFGLVKDYMLSGIKGL
tara:strand:+ start:681 stop:1364 length:684 start_codon:yes stop_codon:yes gene_type:complete